MAAEEKTATVNAPAEKKIEVKAGAAVKCRLQFKGLVQYGRAIRKVNGRKYHLVIDAETLVDAHDLEALKNQEPNLHIIK